MEVALLVALLVLFGCHPEAESMPGGALHRLTPSQLDQTLAQLTVGSAEGIVSVREPPPSGYTDDGTRAPTPYVVEELVRWASEAAEAVATDFPLQVEACDATTAACGRIVVGELLERAWRRPVTEAEVAWIEDAFDGFYEAHGFEGALSRSAALVLSSPDFLYLVERRDIDDRNERFRLDDYEVASRLSFLLWNTTPDDALLDDARRGLANPARVRRVASRLLGSSKRRRGVIRFFSEWLDVNDGLNRSLWDLTTFAPLLNPSVASRHAAAIEANNDQAVVDSEVAWRSTERQFKKQLATEVERVSERVLIEGGTLRTLLTTPLAFVGPFSRRIYDVPPSKKVEDEMEWATLDANQWPGLLTRGAVLAGHGHLTEPSPVLRGAFLAERVLCDPPPAPPAGIPSLGAATQSGTWTTNRERYELASSPPTCAQCHDRFNPYGYALEGFHAIGAPRSLVDGGEADTRVELPGGGWVEDPAELMEALASSRQVHDCFVSEFFRFATYGTATTAADEEVLAELQEEFWESGGELRELVLSFVSSDAFLTRSFHEGAP